MTAATQTVRRQRRSRPLWRVFGSSVTGTSHLSSGRGCDDAHAYRSLPNGTLLLAVADGAGSAARSAEGARAAATSVLDSLQCSLTRGRIRGIAAWESVLTEALSQARAAVESLAAGNEQSCTDSAEKVDKRPVLAAQPAPLGSFATTLLFTVVTRGWIAAAQIGDGAIVIQETDGQAEVLTWPDHGQYANETSFLTGSTYLERAQRVVRRRAALRGVMLLTDGLERLALDMRARKAYGPFFEDIIAFAAGPEASESDLDTFLASEAVCDRTDDDKTLLTAVPR